MEGIKDLPRSQEPRDHNRPLVKANAQLSSDEDLTTITVAGYMDDIRSRGILNKDNTRVREPQCGDIFIFDASSVMLYSLTALNDDGYTWSGKSPVTEDGLKRRSFYYRSPTESHVTVKPQHSFRKTIYYRPADHTCLIHYRGDHTTAVPKLKHRDGKQQKASREIIRQRINEIDPHRNMGPSAVLDKLMANHPDGFAKGISFPHSRDLVGYYKKRMDQSFMARGREVINISFLDRIFGQPYVNEYIYRNNHQHKAFFFAHSQAVANMKHLLKTMEDKDTPLVLHFDTTIKFGNYHLSPLVYHHPQIIQKDDPVENQDAIIPLVHVLHENKSLQSLDNFFKWFLGLMEVNCQEFLDWPKVLVSGTEFREEYMPNTKRVFCEKHLIQDLERHAIGLGIKKKKNPSETKSALRFYIDSITDLMSAETLDDYQDKRDRLFFGTSKKWNSPEGKALAEYYRKNLENDFTDLSSNWYLDSLGLGHLANGLTNEASVTYNKMIGHLKPKGYTTETADLLAIQFFSFENCLHDFVLACYFGRGEILHCIIILVQLHFGVIKDLQNQAISDTSHSHCYLTLIVSSQYLMVGFIVQICIRVLQNGFDS